MQVEVLGPPTKRQCLQEPQVSEETTLSVPPCNPTPTNAETGEGQELNVPLVTKPDRADVDSSRVIVTHLDTQPSMMMEANNDSLVPENLPVLPDVSHIPDDEDNVDGRHVNSNVSTQLH